MIKLINPAQPINYNNNAKINKSAVSNSRKNVSFGDLNAVKELLHDPIKLAGDVIIIAAFAHCLWHYCLKKIVGK